MGDKAPLYEHSKEQLCTFCDQNALILKKIMEFKDRIPLGFQEFENFVKGLVDWNPSPDVVFTIWYKAWLVQEKLTGNKIPSPVIDLCNDDNDVSEAPVVACNEVPGTSAKTTHKKLSKKTNIKIKMEKIAHEEEIQDNKYHLRSMGPILEVQPIQAFTVPNKRKASPKGPQTKHLKKNKKVKDEPLVEE